MRVNTEKAKRARSFPGSGAGTRGAGWRGQSCRGPQGFPIACLHGSLPRLRISMYLATRSSICKRLMHIARGYSMASAKPAVHPQHHPPALQFSHGFLSYGVLPRRSLSVSQHVFPSFLAVSGLTFRSSTHLVLTFV